MGTGTEIVELVYNNRTSSDRIFDELKKDITTLNSITSKMTERAYDSVILKLEMANNLVVDSFANLSQVSTIVREVETVQKQYRENYGRIIRSIRNGSMELVKHRDGELAKILYAKENITIPEFVINKKISGILNNIHKQGYKRIDNILTKWKNFVYDNFVSGVLKSTPLYLFRQSFFQPNGNIKIGSSLDQETIYESMKVVTGERAVYNRARAKANGFTYCWNANPMDIITKPICMTASLAGVISENELINKYGYPPRSICRCEIIYVDKMWDSINNDINKSIEQKRVELIEESKDWPKKKEFWYTSSGMRIVPVDSQKRKNEMYKRDKKLLEVAKKNIVPKYTGGI